MAGHWIYFQGGWNQMQSHWIELCTFGELFNKLGILDGM